jgi:hypothetical protein
VPAVVFDGSGEQERVSLAQPPLSAWKPLSQLTTAQLPYPLPVQLWLPEPFAIVHDLRSLMQTPDSTW